MPCSRVLQPAASCCSQETKHLGGHAARHGPAQPLAEHTSDGTPRLHTRPAAAGAQLPMGMYVLKRAPDHMCSDEQTENGDPVQGPAQWRRGALRLRRCAGTASARSTSSEGTQGASRCAYPSAEPSYAFAAHSYSARGTHASLRAARRRVNVRSAANRRYCGAAQHDSGDDLAAEAPPLRA